MANNNWSINLIGSLDEQKTKDQINLDIRRIQDKLNDIELRAHFENDVLLNLERQLNTLQVELNNVSISQTSLNNLVTQINNALQGINFNNINIGNINVGNQAQQTGQRIGQQIVQGVSQGLGNNIRQQVDNLISDQLNDSLKNITSKEIELAFTVEETDSNDFNRAVDEEIKKLQKLNNKLISVRYTTDTEQHPVEDPMGALSGNYEHIEKLTGAVFRYNTETGEAITKTMKWAQIGTTVDDNGNDIPLMGWVQGLTTYNKSLEETTTRTNNFVNKQKQAVANFTNDLSKIQSRINDQGVGKPIKDQTHIQDLNTHIGNVNNAIANLGTSSSDTFTDMKILVQNAITELENLERQYRNAETTATSLRSKDIATVKSQYSSKLDVLVEKMQSSGVYSNGFQKGADNLRNILNNATDSTGLTQFLNGLDKLESGYKRAKASADAFNQSQKVGIKTSGLQSQIADLQRISPEIDQFEANINAAKVTIQSLGNDLANVVTQSDFSVVNEKWKAFKDSAKSAGIAITEVATKSDSLSEKVNKIQLLTNGGIKNDYSTQIAQLEGKFRSLGLSQDEITRKTSTVASAFESLKTRLNQPFDVSNYQEIITLNDALQRELIETGNEYSRLQASSKGMATEQQRLSLANTIEAWNQKNTAATKEAREENKRYILTLRDLNNQMTKMQFNQINTAFKQTETSMRALNRLGKSVKDQFIQAYQSFTTWLSVSTLVTKTISETREAFNELKQIDTLLTEISKANANLNKYQLTQIGNNSFDIASKYGKTATDFLSGVQEASRAGYENAEAMAELSTAAQGAGDMTADIANQFIIATDKAYKLGGSIEELTKIMNGVNYITNHNAVNMTELSEGMTIVASTASSLGVDVNELTAALGTMSATTQQSGSEVARAFKAILLNIRQVSDADEGIDAEGLTKYEKACNALGVSLKETVNGVLQTRDAMEVLEELSEAYNKLDENDLRRTNLLNSVGGKLRSTQLDALLRQWDTYETMLQQFADGNGSMAREAKKTANSWE